MDALYICGYIVLTALVVWLSMQLGRYVDLMDKKSNISGAFIGGVLLAAVTSLPELFTSISAVWIVRDNSLVVGDILGSNLVNLAFFGIIMLIFTKKFKHASFTDEHIKTLLIGIGIYVIVLAALAFSNVLQFGWFNIVSPIIIGIYILYIYKMPKSEGGDEEGESAKDAALTLKQVIIRFAICAVLLIAASVGITYTADYVAKLIGLNSTVAGALFLGVATSIPELISSITLCHRGNFNASAGNIFGSNLFNFFIICFADLISFAKGNSVIFDLDVNSLFLTAFGILSSLCCLVMLIIKKKKRTTAGLIGCQTLNSMTVILYALFLIIPAVCNIVI